MGALAHRWWECRAVRPLGRQLGSFSVVQQFQAACTIYNPTSGSWGTPQPIPVLKSIQEFSSYHILTGNESHVDYSPFRSINSLLLVPRHLRVQHSIALVNLRDVVKM